MSNYRFGIDIDGTVTCPTSLLPHINKAFSCNLVLDDIKEYDLTKAFPVSAEDFYKWFKLAEPEIYATSPIQADAHAILTEWKKEHEIYFISARGDNVRDVTLQWFIEQNIQYDHIELIGTHNKIQTVKNHAIDVFFEDKHDNAVGITEELNIPVLLFNTPYNQQPVPNGVIRVNNWLEADAWIQHSFLIK
ncbi:hypothetical protein [Paenisporosarcina sp. TG20]|uniref:hypothetical protein n=1 Tax=Paenisporosarcina sp. TG20 TaxID=1211706 RepID=UPI0002DEB494|nr:hypothetical protein [Paenisporosarcina sp. TG20]